MKTRTMDGQLLYLRKNKDFKKSSETALFQRVDKPIDTLADAEKGRYISSK